MRRAISAAAFAGLVGGAAWAAGGCQLIGGFEAFTGAAGGPACAARATDAGAAMVSQARAGAACFWIDEHEVTVEDYLSFVAGAGQSPQQSAPCDGNTTFQPDPTCWTQLTPEPSGALPMVCVDHCDALAYCTSVGKRLCQGDFQALADPAKSEWFAACSNDGAQGYPYGKNYAPGLCNGGCTSTCATEAVGSRASCAAACGARDLSGNVAEWVDQCNGGSCLIRGGGATDGQSALGCEGGEAVDVLHVGPFLGFRCCADPR